MRIQWDSQQSKYVCLPQKPRVKIPTTPNSAAFKGGVSGKQLDDDNRDLVNDSPASIQWNPVPSLPCHPSFEKTTSSHPYELESRSSLDKSSSSVWIMNFLAPISRRRKHQVAHCMPTASADQDGRQDHVTENQERHRQ